MSDGIDLPPQPQLRDMLRTITERLAQELAQPQAIAPDWSSVEWRLARAVAVIHCISPLLAGGLRWQGPPAWREFLEEQKRHVAARHGRVQALLREIDASCRTAGIAVVGLKGAALHAMEFYRPGERPMADVDLLAHPRDAVRIGRTLESLGYCEAFTTWKHAVFAPSDCRVYRGLGEHADNHLKIELHTRIAEMLPFRITDVTDSIPLSFCRPGLNPYPSTAALMIHLLLHAAGAMAYRAMRVLQLHDIAAVSAKMSESDWQAVMNCGRERRRWWALPPLRLTARYFPGAIPTEALVALGAACPWRLRRLTRDRSVSDYSLSYPWIEAFPGIGWSQSLAEIAEYVGARVVPNKEMQRQRTLRTQTDLVASQTEWCGLSQRRRMLRWLTSRPLRVETLHAVRLALAQAP